MSRPAGLLSRGYRCLLRLYPATFRAEFAAEMDDVFGEAVADATQRGRGALVRLCLRELCAWPGAVGRQWTCTLWARFGGRKGAIMDGGPFAPEPLPSRAEAPGPVPRHYTLLAALALLVPGLALAAWFLPGSWRQTLVLGSYLYVLLGLLAGWVRGFPTWSCLHVGYSLLFALWLSVVSSPGLELLGHTFGANEVWGWRAWLGLAVVALLALLLTRSLRPLARLFAGAWRDPTRLSLVVYGTLPLVIWVLFDEVHDPYRSSFEIVIAFLLAAGAVAYVRSETTGQRILSLLAGLTVSWIVSTAGLAAYWNGPRVPGHAPFHWFDSVVPMVLAWAVVAAILLAPASLSLLQQRARPHRTA